MGKGVQVKYQSFNENGMDMIYERTVCRVYVLTIPTPNGDDNYLVLGTEQKTEHSDKYLPVPVMIQQDNLNFIEFNGKTYPLRNISDLNICCNDIKTELDWTEID